METKIIEKEFSVQLYTCLFKKRNTVRAKKSRCPNKFLKFKKNLKFKIFIESLSTLSAILCCYVLCFMLFYVAMLLEFA